MTFLLIICWDEQTIRNDEAMPERHFILPEGACGEGISKGNLVPLGPPVGVRDPMRRGPGFLLLFSIKSKEERLCFAEKVPNGRISNVAQANFLVRMHPIGACAANSWRDCAHQKRSLSTPFFISFYTHRRKTLLPSPPAFRPFPPAPNRGFHPDSGRQYPRDRSDKSS